MNYEIAHPEMLSHATDFYGIKAIPGKENNPRIMQMFELIGHKWVQGDETAWCSAFINYLAKRTGYEYSGKLDARSWLKIGSPMTYPTLGDVVVFWREKPDSWKGHVGLFIHDDGDNIYCLGGNQADSVNIQPYPRGRLLGYRMLNRINTPLP